MPLHALLMDDDAAAYLIYERIIRDKFGPRVTLDHCRDDSMLGETLAAKRYAVVILDQRLSNGTTGLQLVPVIRKTSPGTRILLNSAFGDEELAADAIDAGVDAYVLGRKQDDEELLRVLDRELDGFHQIEGITSQLNGLANGEIRVKCDELTNGLRRKIETLREKRDDPTSVSP